MPAINPLPTPPSRNDPANFSDRADAFLAALPAYTSEANALLDDVHTSRDTVQGLRNEVIAAGLENAAANAATATTKAAEAASSASEAFGYLQAYRATSYGALAADPVVDPYSNPPTVGDEYFNTSMNLLKRFNGVTWQASDIATADLAAPGGSALVGYDGGTVQDVLDDAKPMADYTALRAYTGRATGVRITQAGLAGFFQRDVSDTTSADNGGTIIVDASGRRWKRLFDGVISVKWFGAVGDGVADDTNAFQAAAALINTLGGGVLRIPFGTYKVFRQEANPSPSGTTPYWVSEGDIIQLVNCNGVRVEFDGAEMVAADGQRYGSFDPLTGDVFNPPAGGFTNVAYAAAPGDFISLYNCKNVEIINPVMNGKNNAYIVGGYWGDTGIQLSNVGIRSQNSENVKVTNAMISYCGLDGLYVTGAADQRVNVTIESTKASYNGRQGLSWTGGSGLTAINCVFEKTGRGGVSSLPGAGLDIEDNGQGCYDGLFDNCEFFDTAGVACLVINKTDRIRFNGCVMANPSTSRTLWANANGITLDNCSIYGNVTNLSSSSLNNCYLTNRPYKTLSSMYTRIIETSQSASLTSCTVDCYSSDDYNFNISGNTIVDKCTFRLSQTDPVLRFRAGYIGGVVTDSTFVQNYTLTPSAPDITLAGEHTFIDATANPTLRGRVTISGSGLAWGSRLGERNVLLTVLKQSTYTDETVHTLSGAGPTFDIDVGTGNHLLFVYKIAGNTVLRNVAAIFAVTSMSSTTPSRHGFAKLTSRESDMGAGGSIAMAVSGSTDVIRFTQGTVALSGEAWIVRKVSLSSTTLPI